MESTRKFTKQAEYSGAQQKLSSTVNVHFIRTLRSNVL